MDKCEHGYIQKRCVTCYSIEMHIEFPDYELAWND